jgi:exodeoxyribonuclease V alpha subunit
MIAAIRERAGELQDAVRQLLPQEAFTIHRLLRYNPASGFEHGRGNPLPVDVLIVDEASMLDVALATRLLEAVPAGARIVLLGDKDQLAAVESGAVFAEISSDAQLPVTLLTKNWRFPEDSGIGRLAAEVRRGDPGPALAWLRSNSDAAVRWEAEGSAIALAQRAYQPYFDAVLRNARDLASIEAAFAGFRVLCAVREGPQGVEAFNREMSTQARALLNVHGPGEWYPGRPVMVLVNDYAMKLFNGDVGIALPDEDASLKVWFREGETWRAVPPARVPRHETAYAMTVHKAQGSEFRQVLMVLPSAESRVLSRELIYTGISRAREGVVLHGGEAALRAAISRPTQRRSGLSARLREAGAIARQ